MERFIADIFHILVQLSQHCFKWLASNLIVEKGASTTIAKVNLKNNDVPARSNLFIFVFRKT